MNKVLERSAVCAVLLLLSAGCAGGSDDTAVSGGGLTPHERDSVLAESRLPGARGVKTVLTVADSANARTERLNDLAR